MSPNRESLFEKAQRLRKELLLRWKALDPSTKNRIIMGFIFAESLGLSILIRKILVGRRAIKSRTETEPTVVSVALSALLNMISADKITQLSFFPDGKLVGLNKGENQIVQSYKVPGSEARVFNLVEKHCAEYTFVEPRPNVFALALQVVVPLAFLGVWYKLLQQFMKSTTEDSATNFDRRTKIPKISFHHVVSSSKVELKEIVDYLNNPKSFSSHGAQLPRGVLLVGASGTGKTLMARAVAGEAKCAFLSVSASEFVETYVGRGSARVRQLFKQAREMAPCVLFIDEIDALGRRQSHFGGGSAHDEYVQTMNQLLVEMDGISGHDDGLVVIGATNRFNALDNALLRPGRFDRHVWLHLPAEQDRLEILKLNCVLRPIKLDSSVDWSPIAREAMSFSGADLANLVNESVFFSLRRNSTTVSMSDARAAFNKCKEVVINRNKNVSASSPRRQQFFEDISAALE